MAGLTDTIHFALVGCGHIGKRHIAMIQENPEAALVAVCDVVPKQRLQLENVDVPFFTSLEELLAADLLLDVVCICTPNGFHASQAVQVLEAKKHVVVEKPLGLTKSSCEAIIFKALNVSRQVFCVMQNRYSPPVQWLKEIVEQQVLGDIFMVELNCYWNRDERYYFPNGQRHAWHGRRELDGGTLFTQFAHFVDILYWLFGDIKNIQAHFANFNHQELTDFEDSGIVHFDFVQGGMGCLTYSTAIWNKNFESSITIIGSRGTVKIGGQYMDKVEHCHIQDYTMPTLAATNPSNEYGGYQGSAANHQYVIQNVVDVLKGRQEATTNALEGLKVVDIIERIYQNRRTIDGQP